MSKAKVNGKRHGKVETTNRRSAMPWSQAEAPVQPLQEVVWHIIKDGDQLPYGILGLEDGSIALHTYTRRKRNDRCDNRSFDIEGISEFISALKKTIEEIEHDWNDESEDGLRQTCERVNAELVYDETK
jgi:hypothetical protein